MTEKIVNFENENAPLWFIFCMLSPPHLMNCLEGGVTMLEQVWPWWCSCSLVQGSGALEMNSEVSKAQASPSLLLSTCRSGWSSQQLLQHCACLPAAKQIPNYMLFSVRIALIMVSLHRNTTLAKDSICVKPCVTPWNGAWRKMYNRKCLCCKGGKISMPKSTHCICVLGPWSQNTTDWVRNSRSYVLQPWNKWGLSRDTRGVQQFKIRVKGKSGSSQLTRKSIWQNTTFSWL